MSPKVVLVGWPSADWKIALPLAEAGYMPSLASLIDNGVMGDLASVEPVVGPAPVWCALTGRPAHQHEVLDFSSATRRSPAIWDLLSTRGIRCAAVGWPGIYPESFAQSLTEFRVDPSELEASHLIPFVPAATQHQLESDERIDLLRQMLAECSSLHAAATWLMEHEPWDFMAICYPALDGLSRAFMGYHPPHLPHIPPQDFELLRLAVTGAYRFHDMMLGRLLELAGPDATIVLFSDHGFHSDHLRLAEPPPRTPEDAERWHSNTGVLCMKGPGIRRDERLYGANLFDLLPTLLALYGLAPPTNVRGRVLAPAFLDTPHIGQTAPEETAGPWRVSYDGPADSSARQFTLARSHLESGDLLVAIALLEKLISESPKDPRFAIALAVASIRRGDPSAARAIVERAALADTNAPMASYLLGVAAAAEGATEQALEYLHGAGREAPNLPQLRREQGKIYLQLERWEEAASAFQNEISTNNADAEAWCGLSIAHLRLGRVEESVEAASRAVALCFDRADNHFQLGMALMRYGQPVRAGQAFETCLELGHETAAVHDWLAAVHEQATKDFLRAAQHRQRARELAVKTVAP